MTARSPKTAKSKPLINGGALDLLADGADGKRASLPILGYAYYSGGVLAATDLDLRVEVPCPDDLVIVGACALPLDRLRKALTADPGRVLVTPTRIDPPAPPEPLAVPELLTDFIATKIRSAHFIFGAERRAFIAAAPPEVKAQAEAWSAEHMADWAPSARDAETPTDTLYMRLRAIANASAPPPAPPPPRFSVTVETPELTLKLETLDAADFPAAPAGTAIGWIRFDAADFRRALDAVLPVASTDETRYDLNAVFVEPHDDGARFAATDGYRLHLTELPAEHVFPAAWPTEPPANGRTNAPPPRVFDGFSLPRRLCEVLARRVNPVAGKRVGVQLCGNFVEVKVGDACWTAREVDGQFPDYRQIIPTEHDWQIEFDAATLDAAVAKLAKATGISANETALTLSLGGAPESFVSLGDATRRDPIGRATYTPPDVSALYSDGEPNPRHPFAFGAFVGLNFKYLREAIEALGDGALRIRGGHRYVKDSGWSAGSSPTVLTRADDTGPTVVLMPIAL